MITGLIFVLLGVMILIYPQVLIAMIAGVFILLGVGIMAVSWQFRRLRRHSVSPFVNWIVRF